MSSLSFEKYAGLKAILAGISGFLYAVAFIIISRSNPALGGRLSALFLLLAGFLTLAPLGALYLRFKDKEAGFALVALLFGVAGAVGMAIHGGYDLANAINPAAASAAALAGLPSQVDPRGLLTFGASGLALFLTSWLIITTGKLPRGLAYLGYVSATLSVVLYLGRLIVLNPANPAILWPALLNGFVANPVWYIWLGVALWRK